MRAGNKVMAAMLAAAVWIYAAMALAPTPVAQQPDAPAVVDVAASAVRAIVD